MKSIALLLLLPLATSAQIHRSLLDSFMQAEVAINHFNGNVLVAKSGDIVFQKSYGYRDYSTKEPLDNHSIFELQSITKQFTALAILQLIEKGALSFTDTLRKFFPELPYSNVTIRQMLTHTSGLPDDIDALAAYWDHKQIATNRNLVDVLAQHKIPSHFKPGERWEYSNTAFELLASIIEKVSGLRYEDYLQQYIFSPAGMRSSLASTEVTKPKKGIADYAFGFIYSDSLQAYILPDTLPQTDFVFFGQGTYGAGNISTTTGDLLKWDRALKEHRLLTEGMQKAMLSPQSLMDTASKRYYGYGVMLGKNEIGDYVMHGGAFPGYHNMLVRYLQDDVTIIVLSNNESNATMLSGALAYIATGRPVVVPYNHKTVVIHPELLDNYQGRYSIPDVPVPTQVRFIKKGDKLLYQFGKDTVQRALKPESDKKFFVEQADLQFEFETDKAGKVEKGYLIVNGMKKEMKKLE